jgi:2-polyprenyl-6-methoxyphenol hydroxylase-like FAD-dependent oxidoreductase
MREERVPVLIVGGGGAGLTASMLLSRMGVDHLLVNARPHTSDLPKAHVLNQRGARGLWRRRRDRRAEHDGRAEPDPRPPAPCPCGAVRSAGMTVRESRS